jgi:hypothetical protein
MLLTDRRRLFGRREEDDERGPDQGSLFAPDAPAARSPGATPDPFAPPRARGVQTDAPAEVRPAEPASRAAVADSSTELEPVPVVAAGLVAPPAEFADTGYDDAETMLPEDDLAELERTRAHRSASRSVLAGPTLDDVMSRVWEGLRAQVPTPCPVCRAEIEPSAHGHCGACGSTLD